MMDKQQFILDQLSGGAKTFDQLYGAITKKVVMHRDGLESVLNGLKNKKIIYPDNRLWKLDLQPNTSRQSIAKELESAFN